MQEYWLCEKCRSMNRSQSDRCYHCKAPRVTATMASVIDQRPADAVTPGIEDLRTAREAVAASPGDYIDASWLGYLSALMLLVLAGLALALMSQSIFVTLTLVAPQTFQVGPGMIPLGTAIDLSFAAVLAGTAIVHGLFLAATSANVPALGGGRPYAGPVRAGLWWLECLGWTILAAVYIWIAPIAFGAVILFILYIGAELLSSLGILIAFGVLFWGMRALSIDINIFRHSRNALKSPARPLQDLSERLVTQGGSARSLVGSWTAAWTISMTIEIMAPFITVGLILLIILALFVQALSGLMAQPPSGDQLAAAFGGGLGMMNVVMFLTLALSFYFLARLTLALVAAQKARYKWLTSGQLPPVSARSVVTTNTPPPPTTAVTRTVPGPLPLGPAELPKPAPVLQPAPRPAPAGPPQVIGTIAGLSSAPRPMAPPPVPPVTPSAAQSPDVPAAAPANPSTPPSPFTPLRTVRVYDGWRNPPRPETEREGEPGQGGSGGYGS